MSERLQNKMFNYEVTPPVQVWGKINAALDESEMSYQFPSKLYGLEVEPPTGTWDKIITSLDGDPAVEKKTFKISTFTRYAVAAVLIGLISFGSIQLFKSKTAGKELAGEQKINSEKDSLTSTIKEDHTEAVNETATLEEKRNDAALEESKYTIARIDIPPRSKLNNVTSNYLSEPEINEDEIFNQLHYADAIHTGLSQPVSKNYMSSRYITLLTTDGNLIRMSKKLMDLACCVSGEEQDAVCQDKLQQWRQKIACSPVNASSGNIMDILGLVNSLQNNKD